MKLSPLSLSLGQLQYAVAVADTLSFRAAAERCHVAQPSLSAQLAQLEEALGVRLFERDRRRVLLTGAGRELVERARRVLQEAADLVDAASRAGDPLSGRLAIGVIPTISPYLLPTAAPALRKAYPRLTIAWREEKTRGHRARSVRARGAAAPPARRRRGPREADGLASDRSPPARRRALLPRAGAGRLLAGACARERVPRDQPHHARADGGGRRGRHAAAEAGGADGGRAHRAARPHVRRARTASHHGLVWRRGFPLGPALRKLAATIRSAYPRG
jgi:LysR family hydrogen peroxide-inducible transcriptional activator